MKRWILCFLPLFLLSGCGSYRETDKLTIVSAGALDAVPAGAALTCETVMLSPESKSPTAALLYAESADVPSSFAAANLKLGTDLYWSHAQVLAVDEALCRKGIGEWLDFFSRNPELRMSCRILAVRGAKAQDVFKKNDLSGDVPGYDLGQLAQEGALAGMLPDVPLNRLVEDMLSPGVDPVLPAVTVSQDGQCMPAGAAVLRDGKLSGWLSPADTRMYCILRDGVQNSVLTLSDGTVLNLTKADASISVSRHENKPQFFIKIKADARFEAGSAADVQQLEKRAEKQLLKETEQLFVSLRQTYHSDALGLGREVWRQQPKLWKAVAPDWETLYAEAPISVSVEVRLRESGLNRLRGGSEDA